MDLVIKTFAGLEQVLAAEIEQKEIASDIKIVKRGVLCKTNKKGLYRANMELRTALRVLVPIVSFSAHNEQELYDLVKVMDWQQYVLPSQTFAIDAIVAKSEVFRHSKFVALKTKDAIVDQIRDRTGKRPNVNPLSPDIRLNMYVNDTNVSILLDSSGESLHRRGYRVGGDHEAPINEVLAAGMLQLSKWQADTDLHDAMCGSGTILTEAGMLAHNIVPQIGREYFCFKQWQDFDPYIFNKLLKEYKENKEQKSDFQHKISGADLYPQALRMADRNIDAAGLHGKITLEKDNFFQAKAPSEKGILMLNPPYDVRLTIEDAAHFYKEMGDAFKKNWKGWQVWLITSNLEAVKHLGLKHSARIPLFNGALECRLLRYDIF